MTETIIVMIMICSVVWGGFIFFLVQAVKFEKRKTSVE